MMVLDLQDQNTTPLELTVGTYVLVRSNGSSSLPACIVREGEELAVRYFEQSNNLYKAQDSTYDVIPEDIIRPLKEPNMVSKGQRLFYDFQLNK